MHVHFVHHDMAALRVLKLIMALEDLKLQIIQLVHLCLVMLHHHLNFGRLSHAKILDVISVKTQITFQECPRQNSQYVIAAFSMLIFTH